MISLQSSEVQGSFLVSEELQVLARSGKRQRGLGYHRRGAECAAGGAHKVIENGRTWSDRESEDRE